ncbi:MAG: hypothetical protein EOM24_28175, partial [Chloroflexia bacterium]|nr:hypothetical protein [Chloroflexia bacterium]
RDGQPNATATGDDVTGTPDDEDGVTLPAFVMGLPATVTVQVLNTTGRPATLDGFIDFNGDGTFDQPGERASVVVPNGSDGTVDVAFEVPVTATLATPIGLRFRLSTESGLGPDGPASDGEVEDYLVTITPPYSLGNRVWYDRDNSGDHNPADGLNPGLAGVTLRLLDAMGNPVTDATGRLVTATTDISGYYRFDNLLAGAYLVEVVAENFTGTGALVQFLSSTGPAQEADPNEDVDKNDNGLDLPVNGAIRSGIVTLGPGNSEPTDDNDPLTNPEPGEAPNDRSNRTVDFGFFRPVSVGNQVWYDTNNNRQIDATEVGIPGVRVELFFDADGNGILEDNRGTGGVDETQPVSFTTTITDGLYLFTTRPDALGNLQLLTPGSYVVGIPASEFDPRTGTLRGLFSSGTTLTSGGVRTEIAPPDPKTDRTDGDDNGAFQTSGFYAGGVLAQAVTL